MNHTSHSAQQGFTMVVISALFIAFAVMAAAVVERNTTIQQITRRDATVAQLTKLSNAIIEYSVFNKSSTSNRYPCPAALALATTEGNFGKAENTNATDCTTTTALPAGITQTGTGNSVLIGMVPVQTLSQYGIGINDAFDPWNNRIIYVVNRNITPNGSGDQTNNATINSVAAESPWPAGYAIPAPDFILISLGKDGLGAYKRSGATPVTPSITCPAVANPQKLRARNCDGDEKFYYAPTYTAANATSNDTTFSPTAYFDDILTYYRQ